MALAYGIHTKKPRHTTCQPNLHTPKDQIGIPTCAPLHAWHREVPVQRWRPQNGGIQTTDIRGHTSLNQTHQQTSWLAPRLPASEEHHPKKLRGKALWLLDYFSSSSGGTHLPSFGCTFLHWNQFNPPKQVAIRTIDPNPSSKTGHTPDESWREPRCTTRPAGGYIEQQQASQPQKNGRFCQAAYFLPTTSALNACNRNTRLHGQKESQIGRDKKTTGNTSWLAPRSSPHMIHA